MVGKSHSEAYEAGQPLTEQQKQQDLQVHLDILEALIQAKVNLHLWDAKKFTARYGMQPHQRVFLQYSVYWMKKSIQNSKDEDGLTILSSISDLLFDCDFDEIR